MDQKDYKEIAEIIKVNITKGWVNLSDREESIMAETEWKLRKVYALKLADYFEKEDKTYQEKCLKIHNSKDIINKFNRQQFLKDCGVEK